ncbi:septum formation initiator family protein [Treponema pectinovorum]|uniref:septum formation initiator family protein n=1 Tax=Treponema pectinovorum TaxID=164 RepID=UPI0011C83A23|nr:septum formation initiator family protein [Treponema pectinovorum]
MKKFGFLYAAAVGTFVYVLFSFFWGCDGLFVQRQQREQKRILNAHTESIQKINDSLILEKTALEKDPDVIAGLAKKLGFVSEGDKLVKINGLSFDSKTMYDAGVPLKALESEYMPEWVSKILGMLAFLAVYLYFLTKDIKAGLLLKKKNPVYLEGIPVYDLPQI